MQQNASLFIDTMLKDLNSLNKMVTLKALNVGRVLM